MCQELETIEKKLQGGADMSMGDLEKVDKLAHAMKSLATYKAMKESEGYSGRRGRGADGRYMSREGGSYADGYSEGYSEGMRQSYQSGHYPTGPWPERYRY